MRRGRFGLFELGCAVGAAGGVNGDLTLAVGADLRGGLGRFGRRCFMLDMALQEAHELVDDEEDDERYDQEVQYLRKERTVLENGCAGRLGLSERIVVVAVERDEQVAEIDAAGENADERHDEVIDERCHNGAERSADDNTDCHIDHIALHGKIPEFFQCLF